MRFAAALPVTFLFASITSAQTIKPVPSARSSELQTMAIVLPHQADNCPVALRATQGVDFTRREVGELNSPRDLTVKDVGQLLHLLLNNPEGKRIVAANVTVRGLTEKNRIMETLSNRSQSDAAKTVDVRFATGSGSELSTNVRLPGFSAMQTVDLNSVTYDDGTLWKVSAGAVCRAQVDPLMLVNMR